jgi:hypothetical protein
MRIPCTNKRLPKLSLILHPFLFAVFPTLFLYSHNIAETSTNQVIAPLLFSALGALALWVILAMLLKNTLKAGLATTILVTCFFSYGRVYDLLAGWNVLIARHAYLLPAALLVCGYSIYFIRIARADFKSVTKVLNIVALVLVSVNVTTITVHNAQPWFKSATDLRLQEVVVAGTDGDEPANMPDIYYIILDEYAHPATMLDYYDYDNGGFISELTSMGFFVAPDSRTAYPLTNWSLASSLNMQYLPAGASHDFCFQKMANNAVAAYLKSVGYTYVYSGVWFDQEEVGADLYHNFYESSSGDTVVREFSRTLWNTTMARPFYDHLTGDAYACHYRSSITEQLDSLTTMPDIEGPKFVFAHIICPHAPLLFGPNGEDVSPADFYNFEDKQFYLGQYRYISGQIQAVLTTLIEHSASEPVIILQSDHGIRQHPGLEIGDSEWQKILNAYYLPGNGSQDLYDSISPLNTFRLIFNHYFGTDYALLEDPVSSYV